MYMQSAKHILMVRPACFGYNPETAVSNAFQQKSSLNETQIQAQALAEFDAFQARLKEHKISVTVIEDTPLPIKPDAVFPNNWISFHKDGTVILYPMNTPNRQQERRQDIIDLLAQKFEINQRIDLSEYEQKQQFLEGTGSIVFDHEHKIAYACISPRTSKELLYELCEKIGYCPFSFTATDQNDKEIYHTNVMMNIAHGFAVLCSDSISDDNEREKLLGLLQETGHEVINISHEQMNSFAGNMLCVTNTEDKLFLICSQAAFESLTDEQKLRISRYTEFLPVSIPTIEAIGGGSARCMIAEVFLPKRFPI